MRFWVLGNIAEGDVSSLRDLPFNIIRNISAYRTALLSDSSRIWLVGFFAIFVFFSIWVFRVSERNWGITILSYLVYLALAFVSGASFWLLYSNTRILAVPRYLYVFPIWVTILAIIVSQNNYPIAYRWLRIVKQIMLGYFAFLMVSFTAIFASMLHYQEQTLFVNSADLMTRLADTLQPGDQITMVDWAFPESPILQNAARSHPLLWRIVPPNTNPEYWPNFWKLESYHGLPGGTFTGRQSECNSELLNSGDPARWMFYRIPGSDGVRPLICVTVPVSWRQIF
jgi:hypothetical protein